MAAKSELTPAPAPAATVRPVEPSATAPDIAMLSRENTASLLDVDLRSLDPSYRYRWVHKSPTKVRRARMRGYVAVDPSREIIKDSVGSKVEISTDGLYQVQDVILMRIDRETHGQRRVAVRKKTAQRLGAVKKKTKRQMREIGRQKGRKVSFTPEDED